MIFLSEIHYFLMQEKFLLRNIFILDRTVFTGLHWIFEWYIETGTRGPGNPGTMEMEIRYKETTVV